MLRTTNPRVTLWESILPEWAARLPAELEAVDRLLDDPVFFAPYRAHFHPVLGRPSVPVETYLRMMFLKFRYRLSFGVLCREVADSMSWRRFCRINLGERVPDATTLMKTTKRCGPGTIEALNEALLAKAHAAQVIKTDKVRADTTVVEANVAYPTDSGLLAKGVDQMVRLAAKLHGLGLAIRTRMRDRTRAMRRRAHAIGAWLRRRSEDAKGEVYGITAEMVTIAEAAATEARLVVRNARRGLRRAGTEATGKAKAAVAELERLAGLVEQVAAQTRLRLAGETPPGATRVISLHDPDARPIAKGRIGKPVQFGYQAQVVDNAEGVVVDYTLNQGNPPDAPQLAPAVTRIKARFGKAPRAVAADRGYGEARVEDDLKALGVKRVAIPRKGRPGPARQRIERARGFRKLVKWRTGSEGRISHLKHSYGWDRTLLDGFGGAQTWCGLGILAQNAVKISRLLETKATNPAQPPPAPRRDDAPDPAATGPPGTAPSRPSP